MVNGKVSRISAKNRQALKETKLNEYECLDAHHVSKIPVADGH